METNGQILLPAYGPTVPAVSIELPGIFPKAKSYLEEHGCTVMERNGIVIVSYPEGATSTEVFPRTGYSHHDIKLPDGTELQEFRPFLSLCSGASNCLYLNAFFGVKHKKLTLYSERLIIW
jgi:hypothetical protein